MIKWAQVRTAYEDGTLSIRAIARQAGCSDTAVRKKAREDNWQRSPRQIETPTQSARAAVAEIVAAPPQPGSSAPVVEPPVPVRAGETLDPKEIAKQGLGLIGRMLDELNATTSRIGELDDMIISATEGDPDSRRRTAMRRAVDLPSRAVVLKNLAAAAKALTESKDSAAAGTGKKEQAAAAAETAGQGSDWGDDLAPRTALN